MTSASSPDAPARLAWVDAVRGIGILLMYYGHVVQRSFAPDNASAASQLRFIYSFHMPLFFVLSGFFFRPPARLVPRWRQLAVRRLVPVVFFGLVFAPLWASGEIRGHLPLWHDTVELGAEYLRGRPDLNWVTWFLVCLFVSECLASICLRAIRGVVAECLFGIACVLGGVYLCSHSVDPRSGLAYEIGRTWFFSEAVVALGLLAIGHALYPYAQRLAGRRVVAAAVFVVATAMLVATFRLNRDAGSAVMMAARQHGNALEFAFTALAGTTATIALGVLVAGVAWLRWLGRNTLPLLGLNGIFFHYVDPRLGHLWRLPDSEGLVVLDSLAMVAFSLALCVPAVYLLNRYLPQLIGKTAVAGPWLPALEPSAPRRVTADR